MALFTSLEHLHIEILDLLAFATLFAAYYLYQPITDYILGDDISARMKPWRLAWARQLQWREERITDVSLVRGLVSGVSFFASTSVFIISGLVALLSLVGPIAEAMQAYPIFQGATFEQIAIKVLALQLLAIIAFFKFGWSMRLHSYSTLMIGAMPAAQKVGTTEADAISDRLAEMSFLASKHFHGGMRAYYLGFGALTWFLSTLLFFVTLALVLVVMIRRDYMSKAFRLAQGPPNLETLLTNSSSPPNEGVSKTCK